MLSQKYKQICTLSSVLCLSLVSIFVLTFLPQQKGSGLCQDLTWGEFGSGQGLLKPGLAWILINRMFTVNHIGSITFLQLIIV